MFKLKKYSRINLAYAWLALLLLSTLNLLNYADRNVFNALIDPIKLQFKFSDFQLGLLASAFLWVHALATYPLARIADRKSRKTILISGALLWSVATFFTGFSRSFSQFFLARGILGIGEASYATTLAPLLSDYFPAALRSTALGLSSVPLGLGTALGYYVAGWSLHHFGWRQAFFLLGVTGLFLGLMALWLREPEVGLSDPSPSAEIKPLLLSPKQTVATFLQSKTIMYLWASSILMTFALGGMLVWMAPLLHRYYHFSVEGAAVHGATALMAGSILGITMGGVFSDRWSRKAVNSPIWIVAAGSVASGILVLWALHVQSQKLVLAFIAAVAFCQMATNGPFMAALMNVTLPAHRSQCTAIYIFLIHILGDAASPIIIGFLSKEFGDLKTALFLLPWLTILSGIIALGALFYYPKEKEKWRSALV